MAMDFSKVLLSGAGFLADAYDLFVINIVVDIMDKENYKQALTEEMKSTIKAMALIGAVVGQIGFGSSADLIGRKTIFIVTCALVIIGALGSATVGDNESFGIYSQLTFWRFLLGVGVGGEYPLSAAITSESSDSENRAKNLAMVFSMQGFGSLLCALVLIIVTHSGASYDTQWRIALAFGGFPMAVAFYFRWKMHETSWSAEHSAQAEEALRASKSLNVIEYAQTGSKYLYSTVMENGLKLVGTAGTWFILDIVFYANGLFSGQMSTLIGAPDSPKGESTSSVIIQLLALPGYILTVLFIDRFGLVNIQNRGFIVVTCLFYLLAIIHPYLLEVPALYIILYGLTFLFQNFGANATTYIIPSIIYPTSQKATCHGISAAAGKLGAIFGAYTFLYIQGSFCSSGECDDGDSDASKDNGVRITFFVCGTLSLFGLWWSIRFVQPNVSELNSEDEGPVRPIRSGDGKALEITQGKADVELGQTSHNPLLKETS